MSLGDIPSTSPFIKQKTVNKNRETELLPQSFLIVDLRNTWMRRQNLANKEQTAQSSSSKPKQCYSFKSHNAPTSVFQAEMALLPLTSPNENYIHLAIKSTEHILLMCLASFPSVSRWKWNLGFLLNTHILHRVFDSNDSSLLTKVLWRACFTKIKKCNSGFILLKLAGFGGQHQQLVFSTLWCFSSQPICIHGAPQCQDQETDWQGWFWCSSAWENTLTPMERQVREVWQWELFSKMLGPKPALRCTDTHTNACTHVCIFFLLKKVNFLLIWTVFDKSNHKYLLKWIIFGIQLKEYTWSLWLI